MVVIGFLLLAILLVLSPMMWLRPSRGESLRGQLRQYAKQHGGELNFAKAPLSQPEITLVGYRMRYPGTATGSDFVVVRNRVAGESLASATPNWRWRRAPLPALNDERAAALEIWLEGLPEDALVVESGPHTLCVWWQERWSREAFVAAWPQWLRLRDTLAGSGRPQPPPR